MANAVLFLDHSTIVPIKAVDNGDGTYSLATSGGGGTVTVAVTGTLPVAIQGIVPTYDAGPYNVGSFGVTGSAAVIANITGTPTAITDVPTSGQKLVITDVLLSTDTAMNILLQEETSLLTIAKIFLPANGTVQWTPRGKVKLPTANKRLVAKASVAGNLGVTTNYYSEA